MPRLEHGMCSKCGANLYTITDEPGRPDESNAGYQGMSVRLCKGCFDMLIADLFNLTQQMPVWEIINSINDLKRFRNGTL